MSVSCSTTQKQRFLLLRLLTYLESLSSSCSVLRSLLSVLSGRPLAASELARDTFGRFSGRGVPGPFTFLAKKKMTQNDKSPLLNQYKFCLFLTWGSEPFCKGSVPREHHSIHPIDRAASILSIQTSSEKQNSIKLIRLSTDSWNILVIY